MVAYKYSPFAHFIESRLIPDNTQYGIFHQLTGQVIMPSEGVKTLLFAARTGGGVSLSYNDLDQLADGAQLKELISAGFLVPNGDDPLSSFLDYFVVRPVQNPALAYRDESGAIKLVRTSMSQRVYSPRKNELPEIVEEELPPAAASIFLAADGTKTLREMLVAAGLPDDPQAAVYRETIDFLTTQKRQLIKLTSETTNLTDPYEPWNTVPRNFYHAARWNESAESGNSGSIVDFHKQGIEEASWEFDLIEPTINHAFRFPSEALGGLDYGARFCVATLQPEVLPLLKHASRLEVLEVGGGTGSFARSFIEQSRSLATTTGDQIEINYQIMDLSPVLIQSQREALAKVFPTITHFQQDATTFDLPGRKFNLIVANEVIADFPVALVRPEADEAGSGLRWEGDGVADVDKYCLAVPSSPGPFLVNTGACRFIERAWEHLVPGETLIMSEYGSVDGFPGQAFHLNHEEFSIHFGHLQACADKVGFDSQLLTLKEFLNIDDRVPILDGQEEHIECLNYFFKKYGMSLPYALISESEFKHRFGKQSERIGLTGFSFSPLRAGFHYGPKLDEFMILILTRPQ